MSPRVGRSLEEAAFERLVRGLRSSMPEGISELVIEGTARRASELAERLEAYRATSAGARGAKGARAPLEQDRFANEIGAKSLAAAVEVALRALLGASNPALARFGIKPADEGTSRPCERTETTRRAAKEARSASGVRQQVAKPSAPSPAEEPAPPEPVPKARGTPRAAR